MPRFFTTIVDKKALLQKIQDSPSLYKALQNVQPDTRELDEYAEKQLKKRKDNFLTVQIIGPQGEGKSGVGQALATRWAKKPFTAHHISLHYPGFMGIISRLVNGEFSILDEQTKQFGAGSVRLKGDLLNIIETLRQNGGSIIIISPTEKAISTKDVHLEIEILSLDTDTHEVLVAWKARTDKYLGSCIIKLDWESDLWKEYMKLKEPYVQDAKKRRFAKNDYEALAEEVMQHEDYKNAEKMKEKKLILEKIHPNLTIEEKRLVLTQIGMLEKK